MRKSRYILAAAAAAGILTLAAPTAAFAATGTLTYDGDTASFVIEPEAEDVSWFLEFNVGVGGPTGEIAEGATVELACVDNQWIYSQTVGEDVFTLAVNRLTLTSVSADLEEQVDTFDLAPPTCATVEEPTDPPVTPVDTPSGVVTTPAEVPVAEAPRLADTGPMGSEALLTVAGGALLASGLLMMRNRLVRRR